MKASFKNIFDAWITSLFGISILLITLLFWFIGRISLIWEGVIGFSVGTLLLMAPKSFEGLAKDAIKYIGGRGSSIEDDPTNKPANQ